MYTLKLFGTGQVTLPAKWRRQFDTKNFIAEETKEGLLIRPINNAIFYQNANGHGVEFPQGITPKEVLPDLEAANEQVDQISQKNRP